MVARSDPLDSLRSIIIQSGGGFLRNVQWADPATCGTCAGIPGVGYSTCYRCASRSGSPGLLDNLGLVTYAFDGTQAGHMMYAYKAKGATTAELVASLLTYAVVGHWSCIAAGSGSVPDAWAYVPSLSGRHGVHPLEAIATKFMGAVPLVPVAQGSPTGDRRTFRADNFLVGDTSARHVLLLDDTWVTGGHMQSASAALKRAGVQIVTGLAVARWLDPVWANTKQFVAGLPQDFDPAICPFGGRRC